MNRRETILSWLCPQGSEEEEVLVLCPFHDDNSPSAYFNQSTGLFYCHSCEASYNEDQIINTAEYLCRSNQILVEDTIDEVQEYADADQTAIGVQDFLSSRGFAVIPEELQIKVKSEENYIDFNDGTVKRYLDGRTPKYKNAPGNKGLFWVGGKPEEGDAAWVVEGIFDAMTLSQALNQPVAAALGCKITDPQAFELRGKTVFIVFDADHAGWKGARKSVKTLEDYDAKTIIIDFPQYLGGDINEAWCKNSSAFDDWVDTLVKEYRASDVNYLDNLFTGSENLTTISTGITGWDAFFGGGLKPGMHIIAAAPKTGKTSVITYMTKQMAKCGHRVLLVTYEISKRQSWARLMCNDKHSWEEVESDPSVLSEEDRKEALWLASNVRVVAGWTMPQIEYVSENYDVIVLDYLQRAPGPFDGERERINYVLEQMSNLARDQGKVLLVVSSLNRGVGDNITTRSLMGSGKIEYTCVSATALYRAPDASQVRGEVLINTRGMTGQFWMIADLAKQEFRDSAPGVQTEKEKTERFT